MGSPDRIPQEAPNLEHREPLTKNGIQTIEIQALSIHANMNQSSCTPKYYPGHPTTQSKKSL